MNILLVHNYYKQSGGEDTVFENEKELLECKGNNVFTYTRNNKEIESYGLIKKILLPFITIYNPKTAKDIKKIIKENDIDLVHVHNSLLLISPSVFYAARQMNIPVVQTIHNFRYICANALLYRKGILCEECLKCGYVHSLKYKCYRNSFLQTFILVLSHYLHNLTSVYKHVNFIFLTDFNKNIILKTMKKHGKVFIKPNMIDINLHLDNNENSRNGYIYAGRLDDVKGIKVVLDAWSLFKNNAPKLTICGNDSHNMYHNYVLSNNVNNVQFLGYIDNKKLTNLLSHSKALIYPTQVYEGFPVGILEANSVGTPVICSNIGNAASLITNHINGELFKKGNSIDLYNHIKQFEKRSYVVDKKIVEKYNKNSNYKTLISIYKEIMESK